MAGIHETFATAEDGAILTWDYWEAVGTPKAVVIAVHGGGFRTGNRHNCDVVLEDLVVAGYDCVTVDYRLAPPGDIPGQTTSGRYPRQVDDIKRAVLAVRADARFTGLPIFGIGASAGGSHLAMALNDVTVQASPVAWDGSKRIAALVTLSGVLDFADRSVFPHSDQDHFLIRNYLGLLPAGSPDTPADLVASLAASPHTFVTAAARPIIMFNSSDDTVPSFPFAESMTQKYIDNGVDEHSAFIIDLGIFAHAFDYWPQIKTQVIAWYDSQITGDPPPPPEPGEREVIRGASILQQPGQPLSQAILDDPNVDAVACGLRWYELQPSENVFDFSYFDTEIPRIAAAGKKALIRIATMAGSEFFNGNTPDWVFSAMGASGTAGDRTVIHDGTTTNGSPIVTSPTADFTAHDLHSNIVGDGMPGVPVYVGIINSPTSIGLSSSETANVPINATSTHVGTADLVFADRERVAHNTHAVVWGQTFDYYDPNPNHGGDPQTTIPVFWNPIFLAKKKAMYNALGNYFTNSPTLTQAQKACVKVVAVSFANAQTEDFAIPSDLIIDPGGILTRREEWQHSPTDPDADQRGAGYTTQKMIDTAVNRVSNDGFLDGVSATDDSWVSATANFTFADVGKRITSNTHLPAGTTIIAWVSKTEVQISAASLTTGTARQFQILNRDVGIFDVAIAAFPGQMITSACAGNDAALDAEAAEDAGDPDPKLYLCRTVYALLHERYRGMIVAQRNGISANMGLPPGSGTNRMLWDHKQAGGIIAGQDLWFCFEDPTYRMNGGTNEDHRNPGVFLTDLQICNRAGSNLFAYGASFREMYEKDALNMPDAVKFTHDLFTGGTGPPPPETEFVPTPKLRPILTIDPVNYRDGIIFEICDLLNIALPDGIASISKEVLATMSRKINRHVDYAWRLFNWPELVVLEERPFARIWDRVSDPLTQGELIFDLGYPDPDTQEHVGQGYFNLFGTRDDGYTQNEYVLKSSDYFIELLQRCRRRIGDVIAVFPSDPRPAGISAPIMKLQHSLGNRGLEVTGYGVNGTVFISYRAVPYKYAGQIYTQQTGSGTLKAGTVVIGNDGETHRAIIDTPAGLPLTDPHFALVPFPRVLSTFVIYMSAADMEDDVSLANQWRDIGLVYLGRQIDVKSDQLPPDQYDYAPRRIAWPEGTSGFLWSAYPPFQAPDLVAGDETTIDGTCLNEWGDIIPE